MPIFDASYQDQDLLHLMSEGRQDAFEELWSRHWEQAYNAAFKRLNDEEQSKDLVQDLFIDLWVRREKVSIENLTAYLQSAIRYKVYKVLAKSEGYTPFFEVFETMTATVLGADSVVLDKELEVLAQQWLDTLPAKRKEIFILHYSESLTTKEIAERLGISQKTVQNQLGLASNSLHKKLIPAIVLIVQMRSIVSL